MATLDFLSSTRSLVAAAAAPVPALFVMSKKDELDAMLLLRHIAEKLYASNNSSTGDASIWGRAGATTLTPLASIETVLCSNWGNGTASTEQLIHRLELEQSAIEKNLPHAVQFLQKHPRGFYKQEDLKTHFSNSSSIICPSTVSPFVTERLAAVLLPCITSLYLLGAIDCVLQFLRNHCDSMSSFAAMTEYFEDNRAEFRAQMDDADWCYVADGAKKAGLDPRTVIFGYLELTLNETNPSGARHEGFLKRMVTLVSAVEVFHFMAHMNDTDSRIASRVH